MLFLIRPPKSVKKRNLKTSSCVSQCTINNNTHDANPLDKSSNKAQLKQHCLTSHGGSSGISKIRKESNLIVFNKYKTI